MKCLKSPQFEAMCGLTDENEKGITLVALAITVVVMSIIAGISITAGLSGLSKSKDSLSLSELQIVQEAILQRYTKYKTVGEESFLLGTKMQYQEVENIVEQVDENIELKVENYDDKGENVSPEEYYYEMNPVNLKDIGVDKAKDTYIVNYKTGEVLNKTKIKTSTNQLLYVYSIESE